jgi:hypothetical protein
MSVLVFKDVIRVLVLERWAAGEKSLCIRNLPVTGQLDQGFLVPGADA